jgi:hypothetical protein
MSENLNEDLQKFEEIQSLLDSEEKGMHDAEKGGHEDEKGQRSIFLTEMRFKEMQDAGELISEDAYAELAEDDQLLMEKVMVMDEKGKECMGWAFRFKSEDDEDAAEEEAEAEAEEDAEVEEDAEAKAEVEEDAEAKAEAEEDAEAKAEAEEEAEEGAEVEEDAEAEAEEDAEEKTDQDSETKSDEDDSGSAEIVEEKAEVDETDAEVNEKAAIIMSMMRKPQSDKPSVFLTDSRFKEMMDDGELIEPEAYDSLDDDAKGAYQEVEVLEEGTGKGYGRRYRRRSPLEINAMRKAEDDNAVEDIFETAEEASERASALGCEGTHRAGKMFMPCSSHDEWMDLMKKEKKAKEEEAEAEAEAATAQRQAQAQAAAQGGAPAPTQMPEMKTDEFLCGFSRKSVEQPCDFCEGGCMPTEDLPGLSDIETRVKSLHEGSEIIGSGYSTPDDIYVVDVKRADDSTIQVFLSGEGEELGWIRIDEAELEGKSGEFEDIVSQADAEKAAVDALSDLEIKGDVMGVMVDVFANQDVYVVEVDTSEKSYDVFVSPEGKVLGFDEYEVEDPFGYDLSEEDEIKALEAELQIKRMYSREQREAMAESGEALEDGSFPIADVADLDNAIQAFGRAKDKEAAKKHIMKRAKDLGKMDMIPTDWTEDEGDAAPAAPAPAEADGEKMDDPELLDALAEFQRMMESDEI